MKTPRKAKTNPAPVPAARPAMTRTVKIADVLHHKIRVLSVQKRMPMQEFIEGLLTAGLRDKVYDKFVEERPAAA
jgi:histone acetyltransferase (RNA polymerase elongator complex component)